MSDEIELPPEVVEAVNRMEKAVRETVATAGVDLVQVHLERGDGGAAIVASQAAVHVAVFLSTVGFFLADKSQTLGCARFFLNRSLDAMEECTPRPPEGEAVQ